MGVGGGQAIFMAECSHMFHFHCISARVAHGHQLCPVCNTHWRVLPFGRPAEPMPPVDIVQPPQHQRLPIQPVDPVVFDDDEHVGLEGTHQRLQGADLDGTIKIFDIVNDKQRDGSSDEEFSSPYFVDNKASGKLAKIFSNTSFESSADSFISSDSDSVDSFNFIDKSAAIGKKGFKLPENFKKFDGLQDPGLARGLSRDGHRTGAKVISRQVFMAEKMPPPTIEYLNWSGQDIGFTLQIIRSKFLDRDNQHSSYPQ
ncbi:hypothetical protein QYE76_044936 [Lolium multiflorum]|uniref:RING-type domain-containing protein n=1 Tax=Lolium multiflorum TaxID=4521 RepID=A0AAD8TLK7_LOLMU|nr:hypothetical protein QYE76_044936 [Lolium multiflorum]